MTLTQLEYILAVNKFRHFGKAAASCHITQPTLSMQIQKLEEELDIIIFDRSKNPILPTIDGEPILRQAQIVVREHKKILDIIKDNRGKIEGDFKLAVIPTLAPYIIPLFTQSFLNKYPDINLIIEEYKTEDIIRLLEDDKIDAGLLITPLKEDSLIERVLFYEPFYLFVSPDHQLNGKNKIEEKDLSSDEVWLLNEGHCFRNQVLKLCYSAGKHKGLKGNIQFESGNLETLKNMVLKHSGYTLLPHMAIMDMNQNQKKFVKEFKTPVPTREVSLVYGRSFLKEKVIVALEEEIIKSIPKELKSLKNENLSIVEIF